MKNIHVLPTDKSSRLSIKDNILILHRLQWRKGTQHIYITSDEEIKEGDWFLTPINELERANKEWMGTIAQFIPKTNFKKIILTTDQDLIKDGVQAIDDEFLKWFVKNLGCDEIEIDKNWNYPLDKSWEYKIIITKEKPKQETLEEAAETVEEYFLSNIKNMLQFNNDALAIRFMEKYYHAKKEQERSYSEEEVYQLLYDLSGQVLNNKVSNPKLLEKWFEQFKKK